MTSSAFANYAGVAPVDVASGDRARHRLPHGGDRQLNLALHLIALTQVRMPERRLAASPGGQSGAALRSSAAGSTPSASSSDKSVPGLTGRDSR